MNIQCITSNYRFEEFQEDNLIIIKGKYLDSKIVKFNTDSIDNKANPSALTPKTIAYEPNALRDIFNRIQHDH